MCVSSCSNNNPFSESGTCVNPCSKGYYTNTPTEVQRYECVESCPAYFFFNRTVSLNENMYQCVAQCPQDVRYSDSKKCVDKCSTQRYDASDFSCQTRCSNVFVWSSDIRVCYDACPTNEGKDYKIEVSQDNENECVTTCGSEMYKFVKQVKYCLGSGEACNYYVEVGNEKECYSSQCPDGFRF